MQATNSQEFQHRLGLELLPLCQSTGMGYSLSGYGGDTNAPLCAGVLILSDKLHCPSASLRDGCIVLQMKQGQPSKHDGFSITLPNCNKPPQHIKERDTHKQFLKLFPHPLQPSTCNTGDAIAFSGPVTSSLMCKKYYLKKKRSQDWPDLPLQSKWPELYWDPDYRFSIEMSLRFQVPAQNQKESSNFPLAAGKASLS